MGLFDWFKRKPDHSGDANKMIQPATIRESRIVQPPLFDEPAANHPTKPPGVVDAIRLQVTAQGARAEPEPPPADAVSEPVKPEKAKGWVVSPRGLALIKEFEGCKLKAYRCPAGVWTIGYGWTHGVKPGMVWTRQKAEEMLVEGVKPYARAVAESIGKAPTTQGAFDALTSFAYNAGTGALRKSSMLRLHRQGKYQAAADAFLNWTRGGGKVLPGLVRRRKHERALYLSKL
jgi:lysozyme